jgi:hypothetical protein
MNRRLLLILLSLLPLAGQAQPELPTYRDFDQLPHNYWQRPLKDRFSLLKQDLEAGRVTLDRSSEKAFLLSLLRVLQIPASSQMLLFSTTSLQLSLINPGNPRAVYFSDDIYVGYIPGGRIEIISLDPELGGIFYIFDIPRGEQQIKVERATRCMNCHVSDETQHVPGLVIKSVVPGQRGGSLTAYRIGQAGHQIPLSERFGGWYLTGADGFTNHWGNLIGTLSPQGLSTQKIGAGKRFSYARYPEASSDILPQLLHEHQAGFVNRVLEAGYRARTILFLNKGNELSREQLTELDMQADTVVRYLLFAEEAALPPGGVTGLREFKQDFARQTRKTKEGISLRDFDLKTRLFKYRCSYMIYSPVFQGLLPVMKQRIYLRLDRALSVSQPDPDYAYLPAAEKQAIRQVLRQTLMDLPQGWK